MDDAAVFKALSDSHRRSLLDALRLRDGQTLGELCEPLPMTRYGVMKHLAILEAAGLVVARRSGREKHHFLNPVPIQMAYERWVSRFSRPWAGTLTNLKRYVEKEDKMERHVHMIFIQASAADVWHALTDGEMSKRYYFGSAVEADWRVGGHYCYPRPEGGTFVSGEVLEMDPPHRLVTTFTPEWDQSGDADNTRVTWLFEEEEGGLCKVTLVHEGIDSASGIGADLAEGWARILSGLKTVLESGGGANQHTGSRQ